MSSIAIDFVIIALVVPTLGPVAEPGYRHMGGKKNIVVKKSFNKEIIVNLTDLILHKRTYILLK